MAETGRRRSARVLLSVPVLTAGTAVDGKKFDEETRTLVVNAHGALLSLSATVRAGQTFELTHKLTQKSLECRVVYVGKPQGGKAQVGIEFVKPAPSFWQIDFPPEDWVVPES
ncbi:MAG: PilZ domain-containing protein [Candidatus Acidiferrales bacterium]